MPNKQFFLSFENFEKGLIVLYVRDLPDFARIDDGQELRDVILKVQEVGKGVVVEGQGLDHFALQRLDGRQGVEVEFGEPALDVPDAGLEGLFAQKGRLAFDVATGLFDVVDPGDHAHPAAPEYGQLFSNLLLSDRRTRCHDDYCVTAAHDGRKWAGPIQV